MKQLIYVTDDEKNIRELISCFLQQEGYRIEMFSSGEDLIKACHQNLPDMIILDIMMPGMNGFDVCEQIRKISNIPIIIVSAKDDPYDRVRGINNGSDDYLVKPFLPLELVARVKALFRRSALVEEMKIQNILYVGNCSMDIRQRKLFLEEKEIIITPTEYDFLKYMMMHKSDAVSREDLTREVWKFDYNQVNTRVTDDLVTRLRRKLKQYKTGFEIETVWGFGYRLKEEIDR